MSHEWIFDVLKDLTAYARANGLHALAVKAEETLRVAEVEVADMIRKAGGSGPAGQAH